MPGLVDCLATTKATRMLTDVHTVLADDDLLGIGMNVDRAAGRRREAEPDIHLNVGEHVAVEFRETRSLTFGSAGRSTAPLRRPSSSA
jgi:hypothetical protein